MLFLERKGCPHRKVFFLFLFFLILLKISFFILFITNTSKTNGTLFSLSTSKEQIKLRLKGEIVPQTDNLTFLGVKLDTRLTWKPQIEKMERSSLQKLALMRKLAETSWGADSSILTKVYTATVRPTTEYASTTWGTAAKTNKSRLDKIQNMALRVILGAMKTTPVHDMKKTANVEPLERRRSLKILLQGEKLRRLPSHPLHTNLAQPTKNRLKRQSLNHQHKELSRTHQDIVDVPIELLTDPAWQPDRETDIQIFLSVPGITSKEQLPGELRNLTLALIADRFPHTAWTHVYTDGSAEEGMKNGGRGVYIRYSDGDTTSLSVPGGLQCSNYRAEILAISTAAEHLLESRKKREISPSSPTLFQPFRPSTQLIQTRWSKACTPPLPSWQLSSQYPSSGCLLMWDWQETKKQTDLQNWQSGSADTESCHLQRGQDTSPLSV